MANKTREIDYIFECSWEVCNKIGGIYTVLSSKAKTLQETHKDRIIFIGPDVWTADNPSPWFTEVRTPLSAWLKSTSLPDGLTVRVGRWEIPGRPIAVLVGFEALYASKNEFYAYAWERFSVDSLHAYGDYDEGCAFARAAGMVIESIVAWLGDKAGDVVAHFDEWTTGMGLLYVADKLPQAATVFTTHATSIGRSICGNGKPLYDYLKGYNGDQMARELNMEAKHSIEKTAATVADAFTTVSDVTATECEQLLERRPIVTPNGFENGFVPARNRRKAARKAARECMLQAARALTGCELADNDTFILISSGRCEYRNKGLDVFLDAMATLDAESLPRDVVAFVMVPAWVQMPRPELRDAIDHNKHEGIFDPVLTHWLNNYNEDPVNRRIHDLGFDKGNHKIHVIYVPCYLNGNDGIFNKSYYQLLPGADATVFASYYEPWGYTPLESVAFGVPTVTTDLSGFGQWVASDCTPGFATSGVEVIHRSDSNYHDVVAGIASSVRTLLNANPEKTTEIASAAEATAGKAMWCHFIDNYTVAYEKALKARDKRIKKHK
ncbi:MAG: glycogen/starch synthase [Muribaculaceae bacterium]|nr:glycogen/starch synthase [Muribaculaceae bacterium]